MSSKPQPNKERTLVYEVPYVAFANWCAIANGKLEQRRFRSGLTTKQYVCELPNKFRVVYTSLSRGKYGDVAIAKSDNTGYLGIVVEAKNKLIQLDKRKKKIIAKIPNSNKTLLEFNAKEGTVVSDIAGNVYIKG